MKIPESISIALFIVGLFLILNGTSQKRKPTVTKEIQGTEVVLNNPDAQGLNMRKFVGIICILGGVVAGIAGAGLHTVRQGGIEIGDA